MSNSFIKASEIEKQGLEILLPYVKSKSLNGQFVTTEKGRLSLEIQAKYGDAFMNARNGEIVSLEFKVEAEDKHGNLFLETWSNLDYKRRKRGWMHYLDADYVWYYFIETDDLYIINFPKLWEWAFVKEEIYQFRQAQQNKYKQKNKTCARLVPIKYLLSSGLIVSHRHPKGEMSNAGIFNLTPSPKAA